MGINCTAPHYVASLIEAVRKATAKPIAVYPNSGERYDAETKRWLPGERPLDLAGAGAGWVDLGARIVGGCCRTGPQDIRRLRRQLVPGC